MNWIAGPTQARSLKRTLSNDQVDRGDIDRRVEVAEELLHVVLRAALNLDLATVDCCHDGDSWRRVATLDGSGHFAGDWYVTYQHTVQVRPVGDQCEIDLVGQSRVELNDATSNLETERRIHVGQADAHRHVHVDALFRVDPGCEHLEQIVSRKRADDVRGSELESLRQIRFTVVKTTRAEACFRRPGLIVSPVDKGFQSLRSHRMASSSLLVSNNRTSASTVVLALSPGFQSVGRHRTRVKGIP